MKKLISAVLFASAAVLPSFAQADNYPSDAVTIVVPYPPGGTTDLLARLVAKGLGERTDQAFIVKNRSEEHTSELQSRGHLVCRLLLEKKKKNIIQTKIRT